LAVIEAVSSAVTELADAVKVAVVAPAEMVVAEGTLTAALLLASATVAPPAVAALFSVTVQVTVPPLRSVAGVQFKDETMGSVVTAIDADCEEPL